MRTIAFVAAAVGLAATLGSSVRADEAAPAPAKTLLAKAEQAAMHQKKNVLVMFHATW